MLNPRRTMQGFTLVELMVVVAIAAILYSVALPAYTGYIVRSKIPDATSRLSQLQGRMEGYFLDNRSYVGAPACTLDTDTSKYFKFSCQSVSIDKYVLQAVGVGAMDGFTYTLSNTYQKTTTTTAPTGWTGSTTCWVTKKDGTC